MKKSRKINVLALVKFQTLMGGIAGLMMGIIYAVGGLIMDVLVSVEWISSSETPGLSYGTILAFGALIGMPIIFAGIGGMVGIFEALLFNVLSKWLGGVVLNFEEIPS